MTTQVQTRAPLKPLQNLAGHPSLLKVNKAERAGPIKQGIIGKPSTVTKSANAKTATAPRAKAVIKVQKKPSRKAAPAPITETEKKEPITVAPAPSEGHVKRMYTAEFLMKFRNVATSFPPGVQTPLEIIAEYDRDYATKEALAQHQCQQEALSSLSNQAVLSSSPSAPGTPLPSGSAHTRSEPKSAPPATRNTSSTSAYKLRINNKDDALIRRPMFSPAAPKTIPKTSAAPVPSSDSDKENQANPRTPSRNRPSAAEVEVHTPFKPTVAAAPVTTPAAPALEVAPSVPSPARVVVPIPTPASAESILCQKLIAAIRESDPRRLAQRQKQIDFGKNTNGYKEYTTLTPKSRRRRDDPKTPSKHQVCSKRSWDGQIRKWRRMLHQYDPSEPQYDPKTDDAAAAHQDDSDGETEISK